MVRCLLPLSELLALLLCPPGRLLLPGEVLAQLHLDQPPLEGGPVHPSHEVIDLGEPFGVFYPHKTELFALTILGIDHLVSNVPCK